MAELGATSCPWCKGWVELVHAGGADYRGGALVGHRCKRCGATFLPGQYVAGIDGLGQDDARPTPLWRKRTRTKKRCPACGGRFDQVTLSTDKAWLAFEQCAGCRMIVLDAGELELLEAILG